MHQPLGADAVGISETVALVGAIGAGLYLERAQGGDG